MQLVLSLYLVMKLILGAPLDVLVDARHALPTWFAPGENATARAALEDMIADAENQGVLMAVFSGYRSFTYQEQVYAREARTWPERVDEFIAKPGHSEHQLGTAFDIAWPGLPVQSLDERNRRVFSWVQENAHEYGFIVSYPLKTSEVWPNHNRWKPMEGDFIYEPWRIRYVGEDLAERMVAAGYLDPSIEVLPADFYSPWP